MPHPGDRPIPVTHTNTGNTMTTATVKTPVPMSCGHTVGMDLSRMKPFDKKDAIKRWRAGGLCFSCDPAKQAAWQKETAKRDAERTAAAAKQRVQLLADARSSETRWALIPLTGFSPKQTDYATVVRIAMITAAWESTELDETEFGAHVTELAAQVDSARWWLDHKDTAPTDLAALLAEALNDDTASGVGNENPY